MKLTDSAFITIRNRVVPSSRIDGDLLTLADWQSVLQMAHWLGFDIKTEASKLSHSLAEYNCSQFNPCSIDYHRQLLTTIDRHLDDDTHLSGFESDLTYLKSKLRIN